MARCTSAPQPERWGARRSALREVVSAGWPPFRRTARAAAADRTIPTTCQPSAAARAVTCLPTKPPAPVIAIRRLPTVVRLRWRHLTLYPSRPVEGPSRQRPRGLAVLEHAHAVHEHVLHPHRVLMGRLEGGAVGDGFGVEDDDVREEALLQPASPFEPEVGGGQGGEAPDRLGKG